MLRTSAARRFLSSAPSAQRVMVSAVLERIPVVLPINRPQWETDMEELKWKTEKSKMKSPPKGWVRADHDEEEEKKKFDKALEGLAPKVTVDDDENVVSSIYRKLDKRLYLVVKNSSDQYYNFPKIERSATEKSPRLMELAQDSLNNVLGEQAQTFVVSRTPSAHLQGPNSDDLTLFYRASLINSTYFMLPETRNSIVKDPNLEFAWISRDMVDDYLSPDVAKLATDFLWD